MCLGGVGVEAIFSGEFQYAMCISGEFQYAMHISGEFQHAMPISGEFQHAIQFRLIDNKINYCNIIPTKK